MVDQAKPVTPYRIPFSVSIQHAPLLVGKADVFLRISPNNTINQNIIDNLDSLVTPYLMLASIGALCGDSVNPIDSTLNIIDDPKIIKPNTIEWIFHDCNVDERSVVILVHLLLVAHDEDPIKEVLIGRQGGTRHYVQLAHDSDLFDPYPPMWPKMPFAIDINENFYENLTVIVTFKRTLNEDEEEVIEGEILTWATAVAMGAYGVAPVLPERCSMLLEDSVIFLGNELEWNISKFRSHPSAINGLINAFVVIHNNIAPIVEVTIE